MERYLLYVRKYDITINDYKLYIYETYTNDIFHTIGEMMYRSMEQIQRITFNDYKEERVKYWKDSGYKIYKFVNKYRSC